MNISYFRNLKLLYKRIWVFYYEVVAMVMAGILSFVIISVSYHAYHTNVIWKKRRDEEINAEIMRNKRQSIQMQEGYKLVKVLN